MLDQRRRRWALRCWSDIVYMLYKCLVLAGQEDFISNILHLSNVGSMLGQRRRRRPNIKTALDQCFYNYYSFTYKVTKTNYILKKYSCG